MIKKDKLIQKINSAIDIQKRLVPLLNKHVSASVFFSGLNSKEKDEIAQQFQEMSIAHTKHIDILTSIKDELSKGSANVY
jgi:hypothetical protein